MVDRITEMIAQDNISHGGEKTPVEPDTQLGITSEAKKSVTHELHSVLRLESIDIEGVASSLVSGDTEMGSAQNKLPPRPPRLTINTTEKSPSPTARQKHLNHQSPTPSTHRHHRHSPNKSCDKLSVLSSKDDGWELFPSELNIGMFEPSASSENKECVKSQSSPKQSPVFRKGLSPSSPPVFPSSPSSSPNEKTRSRQLSSFSSGGGSPDPASLKMPSIRSTQDSKPSYCPPPPATPPTPTNEILSSTNILELLALQRAAKERMEKALINERQRLQMLRATVQSMNMDLHRKRSTIQLDELKSEVESLRVECKRMALEVDLLGCQSTSGQTVPLGETNEEFYENIYPGPNFKKKHKTSSSKHKTSSRKAAGTMPGSSVTTSVSGAVNDSGPWCCHMCTFRNHPLLNKCEECDMPRFNLARHHVSGSGNVTVFPLSTPLHIDIPEVLNISNSEVVSSSSTQSLFNVFSIP